MNFELTTNESFNLLISAEMAPCLLNKYFIKTLENNASDFVMSMNVNEISLRSF